jgi:sugar-specific transcriptional regulator TrmB
MIKELENIGLSKKEAQVYMVCLKKGASSAFKIAQMTAIPTTTVYNIVKRLVNKGLVSVVPRRSKKYYEVNNPAVLKSIKEQELDTAQKLIPALSDLYMGNVNESQVKHYTELEGIKGLLDEMIDEAKELLVLGSVEEELKYFQKYFPRYIELRVQKRIPARHIVEDSETAQRLMTEDSKELRNIKIMKTTEKIPSIMYLWTDRVVVISFGEKVRITSIRDAYIYQMMKRNFEILWGSLL